MTEHTAHLQPVPNDRPAEPGRAPATIPHGPDPRHVLMPDEAEHVLRGMWAIEPDYFAALLAEVRLGRPLNLSAIAKARKAADASAADAG